MWKKLATATAVILSISACCRHGTPVELPRVHYPELPRVEAADLRCLSQDAYVALVERDSRLQAALRECIAVIESTKE